ncbi:hypothetical protein DFJ58DRAFT_798711 [Suillus subalutaceus]|uniref:uncharacterized protein n=1 Tax=Suillus subalutaceus TaxID=48586 RepID=UPI001B8672B3|nr:uncharacterized protein DFJ58DRAFT_798711 [Suillus subalutaceus]KAG1846811.1 hypothetical protein DFJ58DRAFT_798711 [Suillus subalutaceus]
MILLVAGAGVTRFLVIAQVRERLGWMTMRLIDNLSEHTRSTSTMSHIVVSYRPQYGCVPLDLGPTFACKTVCWTEVERCQQNHTLDLRSSRRKEGKNQIKYSAVVEQVRTKARNHHMLKVR